MGPDLERKVEEYMRRKLAGLHMLLESWAGTLEGYARENAPWNDQTGHARQSIHAGVEVKSDNYHLYLAHGMEYGPYLETGTPPHIIRPRKKKALYWFGASHPVRQVRHPGTKAQPIIEPTLETHIDRIKKTVLDYWEG